MFSVFPYRRQLSLPNSFTKISAADPGDEFQRRKESFNEIGYEIRKFEGNSKFQNLQTESEVHAAWNSFIEQNTYMVSFYHQLHCLKAIQVHYVNFVASVEDIEYYPATYKMTEMEKRHAEYCFDYLRQGIQCAGDNSVEGPDLVRVSLESPLRGWGVEHQCRKWDALEAWLDEHAAI
ncbi:hypothetical protein DL98DRAFT_535234 [Cadophora sp. DSE1049]|nr:hypothetical protein DL98DRAFT_535234 [Cadophora sp. DSE1049]